MEGVVGCESRVGGGVLPGLMSDILLLEDSNKLLRV